MLDEGRAVPGQPQCDSAAAAGFGRHEEMRICAAKLITRVDVLIACRAGLRGQLTTVPRGTRPR